MPQKTSSESPRTQGLIFTLPKPILINETETKNYKPQPQHSPDHFASKTFYASNKNNEKMNKKQRTKSSFDFFRTFTKNYWEKIHHNTMDQKLVLDYQKIRQNQLSNQKFIQYYSEAERKQIKAKLTSISPKVKQTNLRILSKRQFDKRKQLKEKTKKYTSLQKPQKKVLIKQTVSLLPKFGTSRSSFYKNGKQKLAQSEETIMESRHKSYEKQHSKVEKNLKDEPFELDIVRARIIDKNKYLMREKQKLDMIRKQKMALEDKFKIIVGEKLQSQILKRRKIGVATPAQVKGWETSQDLFSYP